MIKNLLEETIECLKENGKSESDVLWVGRNYTKGYRETREHITYKGTWKDFRSRADFRYDAGFGANEIPMDLIVVGKDFWLERHEYDGSEWWEFKAMPVEPEETRKLNLLLY